MLLMMMAAENKYKMKMWNAKMGEIVSHHSSSEPNVNLTDPFLAMLCVAATFQLREELSYLTTYIFICWYETRERRVT